MSDPFELRRFLDAQAGCYADAYAELCAGEKRSHWMWFVFPQLAGLGHSPMAQRYAIRSRAEAAAYLAHPVLGARLRECTRALLAHASKPVGAIMGHPDDLKLRSSLTLFAALPGTDPVFAEALACHFNGERDARTQELLAGLEG